MIETRFLSVLREIHSRLKDSGIDWAITGSLGMALQGMDLEVHDIDLQTDAAGARAIAHLFTGFVIRPIAFKASGQIRSLLGAFQMQGVVVEIIGDMQRRLPSGLWEEPVRVQAHRLWVERDGMRLPVLSLEHEYEAYLQMGRTEKARLIRAWLDRHGPSPSPEAMTPSGECRS